jgi:hypothetical protein
MICFCVVVYCATCSESGRSACDDWDAGESIGDAITLLIERFYSVCSCVSVCLNAKQVMNPINERKPNICLPQQPVSYCVRFMVFTAVTLKNVFLWDVTP